ncbi:DUF3427 domain-containing protein [Bacillus spizizenii]|nr:DUF3427 domain-containing protein [Bacillus spizizenii]
MGELKVSLGKTVALNIKEKQAIKPTGFWTFFCNPKVWAIDDFLSSNQIEDTFSITSWQKEWFKEGQQGIIRVGHDNRNKKMLNGKPKLNRGIYAVVEITGKPIYSSDKDENYYYEESDHFNYRVPVRYIKNLLHSPILLEDLDFENDEYDKYLIEGFQASSMPLNPKAFKKISSLIHNLDAHPLRIGEQYSRKDIYKIFNVPEGKQGGNWNTGYTSFNNDVFVFVNISSAGRTGHDYDNKFIGDDLQWFGKNSHSLQNASIQSMLKPKGNIYIFTREDSNNPLFTYQGNARVKEFHDTKPVKIIWEFNDEKEIRHNQMAEEIDNPTRYIEGATKKVSVNVYERNPMARKKCLEHYGFSCVICGFDFEKVFGELGKGFIHVHHIIELNQIGKEYEIDPINDLRPVCPNCHAMLHKKKPSFTVEELKDIIIDNR